AIALGVLSAAQPVIALAAVAALVVAYLIFSDLATGFGILMFLSFLSVLPASGSLTPAKGAGFLLALAWVARYTTVNTDVRDFAADLLAGLALATGFVLGRGGRPWLRVLGLAAIPVCALGIFISVSRGGLIAMAVMFVVSAFAAGRWRLVAVPMLVVVAAGAG